MRHSPSANLYGCTHQMPRGHRGQGPLVSASGGSLALRSPGRRPSSAPASYLRTGAEPHLSDSGSPALLGGALLWPGARRRQPGRCGPRVAPIRRFRTATSSRSPWIRATADYHPPSRGWPSRAPLALPPPGMPTQPDHCREAASANPRSQSRAYVGFLRHHAHGGHARPPLATSLSGQEQQPDSPGRT